jgi:hypothetical protein
VPYREKKIYSGKILEVDIYPISIQERKQKRKKKEKVSLPKQKNLNDKNARKHLTRLINTNFTDKDLAVHLTYSNNSLPSSEEEAKKDITNFLRRVKHYRKKNNLEDLKYIAVIEYREQEEKKKPIRIHHHLIINSMDRDRVEELWGKGRANADRLKSDEYGYEALAKYITKDPKGSKRWTQSRNLKQPIVKVNDFRISKRKAESMARNNEDRAYFEKMYPGYIFTECRGTPNDILGCTYINIKMRKRE